jgi:hypothetical protein
MVALSLAGCRQPAPIDLVAPDGTAVERGTASRDEGSDEVQMPSEGSATAKDSASVIRAAFDEGRLPSGDGPVALEALPGSLVIAPAPAALERWLAGDAAAIEYVSLLTLGEVGEATSVVEGPGVAGAVPNVVITPFVGGQPLREGDLVLAPYGMTAALRPAIVLQAGDPVSVLFTGTAIVPPTSIEAARVMVVEPMGAGSNVACTVGDSLVAHSVLLRLGDRALLRGPGATAFVGSLANCEAGGVTALPGVGDRAAIAVTGGLVADGTVRHVDEDNLRVGVEVVGDGRMATHWGTRADLFTIRTESTGSGAQ